MSSLKFLGVMLSGLMIGCGHKTGNNTEDNALEAQKQEQTKVVQEEPVKFPVYNFKDFEPLLHQSDDKTYVVNFWATWCKPCIAEMPYFERIHAEQKDNNVEVLLVSLDMPGMWKSRLEPFVEEKGMKSKVVILDDPKQNEWIPKVSEDWGGGIPATLIYNKDKRTFYEKGFTYKELNEALATFLN
ncbi:redoxin domain-containing protein [Flagellimonas olearia]|uniref:Redoxin domain-containing protein n=1 Tax=Flagellimonas olearia TaxID=552546 RepID=A0A6I1DY92_9FLAO|nr:TlpA disulfide reductase family protein [Allomuricauda olearia]KAB7529529.1 redoxin domain-containing protein [Allomuricauda olearia]